MKVWIEKLQHLQWQKLDRLSVVVFAVLILWLCWKLASLFWWVIAPPQMMQFDRVELGSQQPQIPNISTFSLFNEPSANAPQENVNLELQGVMLGYPNRFSSAVIKLDNTADRYRVGETIGSTSYQLAEVYWDHVILRQGNGSTRELQFKGLPNGLYQPMTPDASQPTATAPQSSAPVNTTQEALGQAIQQMQGNREQYLRDMGVSGNSGEGFEVTERTPTALRNKLGLRPGDRIVSLNGQTVGQGQTDVQLLEQARRAGQVKLEIKRGDQVMTIQQNF
ncbi:type II secretion system protein N [Acinetobacter sp. AS23]|uniref:type II secretion system protein N n=1 Tax=Acinetobacter sp. AS23 TaxID=2871688 RepID=UPI0020267E0C|nr:type II secretion system protein N [Acinetobacter sp. AS23]URM40735.1 general secretion pathway protein [Acinetobacter sp. AS23]